jgi:quinol-cytochrome oxidoreductase complex cytochrome b subunit
MSKKPHTALARFGAALREVPQTFLATLSRHRLPESRRSRAQIVISNVFLHVHSVRTHRFSLRGLYTLGLGVMSAALFGILAFTGLLLMVYYKPTTAAAYHSMKDIIYSVPSGRMIRNIHRWGAHLMVIAVFLHMCRVFYTSSYKQGRAFNWLIGMGLLVVTFALAFTGYLLPWDQLAYWAVTIGSNIAASFGEFADAVGLGAYDVGGVTRRLLLGSDVIADDALLRFYFLHCVLLPLALVALIAVHFWRIRKDGGLSRPSKPRPEELEGLPVDAQAEEQFGQKSTRTYNLMAVVRGDSPQVEHGPDQTVPSWPHAFFREFVAVMVVLAVTMVLAYLFDAPLKEAANPSVPENPAKAPWYFLGLQELVSYSAFMGGVVLPAIAIIGVALIPYLDREPADMGRWFDDGKTRGLALQSAVFGTIVTVSLLALTVSVGWLREWWPRVPQIVIIFVNPGTVLSAIFAAFSLWTMQRRDSIRCGALALFTCFLTAFLILTYFASVHRGPNWVFYWWPSLWPGH